jgi:hypothetical protein
MGVLLRIVSVIYLAAIALIGIANYGLLSAQYSKPLIVAIAVVAAIPAALLYGFGQIVSTIRKSHKELVSIKELLSVRHEPRVHRPEFAVARTTHSRASSPHAVAQFHRESREAGLRGEVFEGVPWRQLPDGSINGLIGDRLVRFRDWREFAASVQRH